MRNLIKYLFYTNTVLILLCFCLSLYYTQVQPDTFLAKSFLVATVASAFNLILLLPVTLIIKKVL